MDEVIRWREHRVSFLPSVEHGGHLKEKVPHKLSQLSQFDDKSLVLLPPEGLRG